MSSSLYYFDSVTGERQYYLDDELKHELAPKYFEHDGSLGSDECEYLNKNDIPFLLKCKSVDADKLIRFIKKHGSAKISIRG